MGASAVASSPATWTPALTAQRSAGVSALSLRWAKLMSTPMKRRLIYMSLLGTLLPQRETAGGAHALVVQAVQELVRVGRQHDRARLELVRQAHEGLRGTRHSVPGRSGSLAGHAHALRASSA